MVEGEGHETAVPEQASCFCPAGGERLAVKIAGRLGAVQGIRVFFTQAAVSAILANGGKMFRGYEKFFFIVGAIIRMLDRIVDRFQAMRSAFRREIGGLGQSRIPLLQGNTQPDMEKIGQIGIK
ncbi:MAG: hypothetical protein LBU64_07340 [Planctomycetota bacterium]|nr:hypothetical protein [Planctomycetota bacterium]